MFDKMELKDKVKFGFYDFGECRELAKGSLQYILSDISDIKKYYVRLGFHLEEFKRCEYYHDFGYCTFEEFCEANLSLDKSAIGRCISVWQNFSNNGKMFLKEEYEVYNYSQLCEMVSLDEVSRKHILPSMSVREIRDYKRGLKNKSVKKTVPNATSHLTQLELELELEQDVSVSVKPKLSDVIKDEPMKKLYQLLQEHFDCDLEMRCSGKSIMIVGAEKTYRLRLDVPKNKSAE